MQKTWANIEMWGGDRVKRLCASLYKFRFKDFVCANGDGRRPGSNLDRHPGAGGLAPRPRFADAKLRFQPESITSDLFGGVERYSAPSRSDGDSPSERFGGKVFE